MFFAIQYNKLTNLYVKRIKKIKNYYFHAPYIQSNNSNF